MISISEDNSALFVTLFSLRIMILVLNGGWVLAANGVDVVALSHKDSHRRITFPIHTAIELIFEQGTAKSQN
jgi:hypothetical protein